MDDIHGPGLQKDQKNADMKRKDEMNDGLTPTSSTDLYQEVIEAFS